DACSDYPLGAGAGNPGGWGWIRRRDQTKDEVGRLGEAVLQHRDRDALGEGAVLDRGPALGGVPLPARDGVGLDRDRRALAPDGADDDPLQVGRTGLEVTEQILGHGIHTSRSLA